MAEIIGLRKGYLPIYKPKFDTRTWLKQLIDENFNHFELPHLWVEVLGNDTAAIIYAND